MNFQVHGEIISISQTQKVSDRFQKREFVVEIDQNTQYPQTIIFEAQQTHCDILDKYQEGDKVSVDFNLRGNTFTNKENQKRTMNTLQAWKIQKV